MPSYHYEIERSRDPDDQIPGLTVRIAQIGGEIEAGDADEAWEFVKSLLRFPGVWNCRMRCGRRRLQPRTYRLGPVKKTGAKS